MDTLNFQINKTAISLTSYTMPTPYLTGRNSDYLCVFDLSEEWDGLTKYATFYNNQSQVSEARILSEGMCRIPYAVLTYGDVEIGVVGKNGKEVVKSSLTLFMPVQRDAGEHEAEIEEPDETVYQQIISKLALIDRGIQTAKVEDGHLYIYLTNDEKIDCGSIASEITGHSIEFAYVNADGELILVRTNGEQINCGPIGGANFPEITPESEGKMLQVVDGRWVLVDPPNSLPEVTALQNGQVLRVRDGAWQVSSPDRAVTSAYINEAGELILVFNNGDEYTQPMDGSSLPVVTEDDNDKILKVVDGAWALVPEVTGVLPAVSASDNGKILQVVDGAWQTIEIDLSDGTPFPVGNGLCWVNGALELDMANELAEGDARPVSANIVATTVDTKIEEKVNEAVSETAMNADDVNALFADVFGG